MLLAITGVSKIVGKFRKYHVPYMEYDYNYEVERQLILSSIIPEYQELSSRYFTQVYPGSWKYSQQNLIYKANLPNRIFTVDELILGLKS